MLDERTQEEFLDFCTGVRGIKMLYDSFAKESLNPEYAPERLNDFLSVMLKKVQKIFMNFQMYTCIIWSKNQIPVWN